MGKRDEQVWLPVADPWALGHEPAALQVTQHRLERPRPGPAAMADVAGTGGNPIAGQIECPVDVPQDSIEPLKAQRARILADPAHILHQCLEPIAAEGVTAPERSVRQIAC